MEKFTDVVETIHLDEAVTAQYVRLLITGYNGKYVDGNPDADWKSVSVYEFQVYENDIPDDLLPDETTIVKEKQQLVILKVEHHLHQIKLLMEILKIKLHVGQLILILVI